MDRRNPGPLPDPPDRPRTADRDERELRMILVILVAAVGFGLAILPTHRADMHAMHRNNCPDCGDDL